MEFLSIMRYAAEAGGIGFALYGGQVFLRQRTIVFRPSRETPWDPGSFHQEFEDLWLSLPNGKKAHGWWLPRKQARKLVFFLPGSIGNVSHELSTLAFLLSLDAAVITVDYPGFGKSEGKPSESGCYAAATAAWEYAVQQKGIEPRNVIVFGRSVGATVGAHLAARKNCGGLVCHGGFTSLPDVAAAAYPYLPARFFCYIRFNTLKYVDLCRCPVLVMHSSNDHVIPPAHGRKIFEKANHPKRFLPLTGDHYGNDWQASPGLREALSSLLNDERPFWN
jgi:pimeloyl-ACP methyl ester carboxylesterase